MAATWSGLGINYGFDISGSSYNTAQVESDLTYIKSLGISKIRIAFPQFDELNPTLVSNCQDMVTRALTHGFYVIWGQVCGYGANTITASRWAAWKSYVTNTLVPYAISSGLSEVCLGNEHELNCDNTTLTTSTIRADLRTLASTIKGGSYTGKVSYSTANSDTIRNAWISEGIGVLDLIGWNSYDTLTNFNTHCQQIVAAFGAKTYVSEFNGITNGYTDFSSESAYYTDTQARMQDMQSANVPSGYFFCYRDGGSLGVGANTFGLVQTNGVVHGGAFYALMGFNFIMRTNANLMNGGNTFRFSGLSAYWLGLSDHPTYTGQYPTQFQILDALKTAKEMGCTVIRSHTLGISVGNSLSVAPTLASITNNTPNATAFNVIDYAIWQAGQLGLRLIIPLTDDHNYYHGGLHTFTSWRGYGSNDAQFYTNNTIIGDFKNYISMLLTHVNQYNNLAYKDDPTILMWETGNELQQTQYPPTTWTNTIATHIKTTIGAQQLVMDGTGGNGTYTPSSAALALTTVDAYTDHFYPPSIAQAQADAQACTAANKVWIAGEYDWTQNTGGTATMTLDTSTVPSGGGSQSLKIVVTSAATDPSFDQLQQPSITLTQNHTYTFTFWARNTGAVFTSGKPLVFGMQQNYGGYNVYTPYQGDGSGLTPWQTATSTSWAQYTFSYTHTQATDNNCVLYFNLGNVATTTNLDLVSLTDNAAPGTNLLSNPSFENASIDPWYNNNFAIDTMPAFVEAVEQADSSTTNIISGDIWWDVWPHGDTKGFVTNNSDKYTMYYPGVANIDSGGNTLVSQSDMQTRSQQLRRHAYVMQGRTPPAASTDVPLIAPTITNISSTSSTNAVAWQGVVGAATYSLERSTTGPSGAFSPVASSLTDASAPYTDSINVNSSYRIRAYNMDGAAGPYSAVYNAYSLPAGILTVSPTSFSNNSLSETITLTNTGGSTLNWSVSCTLAGVTFSPSSGTLAVNATQNVTVTIPNGTMQSTDFAFYYM